MERCRDRGRERQRQVQKERERDGEGEIRKYRERQGEIGKNREKQGEIGRDREIGNQHACSARLQVINKLALLEKLFCCYQLTRSTRSQVKNLLRSQVLKNISLQKKTLRCYQLAWLISTTYCRYLKIVDYQYIITPATTK